MNSTHTHGGAAPVTGTGHHHTTAHGVAGAAADLPGPAPTTAGPHRSDLLNKLDPRVDSDMSNPKTRAQTAAAMAPAGLAGPAPTTAGPHRSDMANKLDPRVDSHGGTVKAVSTMAVASGETAKRNYHGPGSEAAALGGTHAAGGTHAIGATHATHGAHGTAGTHPVAGSHAVGGTHGVGGAHNTPHAPVAGTTHAGHTTHGATTHDTYAPHKSHIANVLDPRVDSNIDHHRRHNGGVPPTGVVSAANAPVDPTYNTTGHHTGTHGTAPHPNTTTGTAPPPAGGYGTY